jgi:hypothetical protein
MNDKTTAVLIIPQMDFSEESHSKIGGKPSINQKTS